ncbi:alpha/beta hydrolase [Ferrovibrio terrae]|uniref:alpha/beta hydrolase n=1 Tax=Ferrovibrio terrae TaxID=2594003 RepID=UPI003137C756
MFRILRMTVLLGCLGVAAVAQAEPVRLVQEGRGLDGELTLAPGKTAKDGLLILVHGTLAHNRMEIMQAQQALLAERGLSTLAVSLSLGISDRKGMYDCTQPHRHSNAQAASEIAAWIDWAAKAGATKIGILGHSRGAAQVAFYAATAGGKLPAAVQKIVLAGPTTFDRTRAASEFKARFKADFAPVIGKAEALVAGGKGAEMMAVPGFMYCPNATVAAASFADYHAADGRNDTPSQMAKLPRPTLVVVAGGDEIVTDLPQRLQALPKLAHLRSITVDGADHFFKDLYGEDLADAVAGFWKE